MIYKAKPGSRLNDEDAQVCGDRIAELMEENDGRISPQIVLDDAKNPDSPLHDFFEWDNLKAAQSQRLHAARQLMGSITVVIEREDNPIREISVEIRHSDDPRAFPGDLHILRGNTSERFYTTLQNVLTNDELRSQVVDRALRELSSWCEKYRIYDELVPLISDIKIMIDEIKQKV